MHKRTVLFLPQGLDIISLFRTEPGRTFMAHLTRSVACEQQKRQEHGGGRLVAEPVGLETGTVCLRIQTATKT